MGLDCEQVPTQKPAINDPTTSDTHQTDRPIVELQWKTARRSRGHKINLACRQVRNIGTAPTEAVALLRLLSTKLETQRVPITIHFEIDLNPISFCHPE